MADRQQSPQHSADETYAEYSTGFGRLAVIADTNNGQAWILSDVTMAIEP